MREPLDGIAAIFSDLKWTTAQRWKIVIWRRDSGKQMTLLTHTVLWLDLLHFACLFVLLSPPFLILNSAPAKAAVQRACLGLWDIRWESTPAVQKQHSQNNMTHGDLFQTFAACIYALCAPGLCCNMIKERQLLQRISCPLTQITSVRVWDVQMNFDNVVHELVAWP